MNTKLLALWFVVFTLFQYTHSIPTHRIARTVKEISQPSVLDYNQFQLESTSEQDEAASEDQSSIIARDSTTPSTGGASSFQSYVPSQFGQYSNQIPSQFNPSQFNQYPSQFPSQFNPNQYIPSNPTSSAATPAGAASDPEASVVAMDESTTSSGIPSSFQSYVPSQFGQYSNQIPSQFNPNQFNQYPSQFPSQFNPNQYIPSNPTSSAATPAGAASDPQVSIVARDATTTSSSGPSSFQSYVPSQFGQYSNQIPSQFNPNQFNQYPSQFPSQFNPNQYIPSNPTSSAATPAGAASDPEASVVAMDESTTSSGIPSSFQSYVPSQFGQYSNQIPSQFNPSQFNQYPSQFPSQFNPNQYIPSNPTGASSSTPSAAAISSASTP